MTLVRFPRVTLGLVCALAVGFTALLVALPQPAGAAGKGIVDERLHTVGGVNLGAVPAIVAELGPSGLNAKWTRIVVSWARLQPKAPDTLSPAEDADGDDYLDSYVKELDAVVDALRAAGITVMMTGTDVPEWASNHAYWSASGYKPGIAMRIDNAQVRAQYRAFGVFLAKHFAGRVRYFECWNEPNLARGIFPQKRGTKLIGPSVYVKMLKTFYLGVKSGSSTAVVIAGATAPRGANNAASTSPQRFASFLKKAGAVRWFNAYSHHPYTPGGSRRPAPGQLPNNPSRCVTLGNLKVLMDIFRSKPFYLTEFAYNTHRSALFGLQVSAADQARYMRQAFALVKRMPRVKVLMWYNVVDWSFDAAHPANGVYCGLVEKDGVSRKPGWYAFAGGNRLTVTAPSAVTTGTPFAVSGALTTVHGPFKGAKLSLQTRTSSRAAWTTIAKVDTSTDGAYSFTTRQAKVRRYRVVWDGRVRERAEDHAAPLGVCRLPAPDGIVTRGAGRSSVRSSPPR